MYQIFLWLPEHSSGANMLIPYTLDQLTSLWQQVTVQSIHSRTSQAYTNKNPIIVYLLHRSPIDHW